MRSDCNAFCFKICRQMAPAATRGAVILPESDLRRDNLENHRIFKRCIVGMGRTHEVFGSFIIFAVLTLITNKIHNGVPVV